MMPAGDFIERDPGAPLTLVQGQIAVYLACQPHRTATVAAITEFIGDEVAVERALRALAKRELVHLSVEVGDVVFCEMTFLPWRRP